MAENGAVYNEAAFRYLMHHERVRAARAGWQLLLILVRSRDATRARDPLPPGLAAAVFDALLASVREIDVVGWYREARVAAALLRITRQAEAHTGQALCGRVRHRLLELAPHDCADLRLRVLRMDPQTRM